MSGGRIVWALWATIALVTVAWVLWLMLGAGGYKRWTTISAFIPSAARRITTWSVSWMPPARTAVSPACRCPQLAESAIRRKIIHLARTEERQRMARRGDKDLDESAIRKSQIEYLEREWAQRNRSVVGKCFRKRNWYGNPATGTDYWWLYLRVTGTDREGNIVGSQFEADTRGNIIFRDREPRTSIDGWEEISLASYKEQLEKTLQKLTDRYRHLRVQ